MRSLEEIVERNSRKGVGKKLGPLNGKPQKKVVRKRAKKR